MTQISEPIILASRQAHGLEKDTLRLQQQPFYGYYTLGQPALAGTPS